MHRSSLGSLRLEREETFFLLPKSVAINIHFCPGQRVCRMTLSYVAMKRDALSVRCWHVKSYSKSTCLAAAWLRCYCENVSVDGVLYWRGFGWRQSALGGAFVFFFRLLVDLGFLPYLFRFLSMWSSMTSGECARPDFAWIQAKDWSARSVKNAPFFLS